MTLSDELLSWADPHKADGLDALLIRAALQLESNRTALLAAQKDLETFEREMTGIAPEAKASSLPLIRSALGADTRETGEHD